MAWSGSRAELNLDQVGELVGLRRVVLLSFVLATCPGNRRELNDDESLQICAALAACLPLAFDSMWGPTVGDCASNPSSIGIPGPASLGGAPLALTGMEAPALGVYRCVLRAGGDCASVRACFLRAGQSECDGGALRTACDGDVARGCLNGGVPYSLDCAAAGAVCARATDIFADYSACALWDCSQASGQCTGGRATYCLGERFLASVDCAAQGATCFATDAGSMCRGPECSTADSRCDGTIAIRCEQGRLTRFDCGQQPTQRRCETGRCVETGTSCRVGADSCAGDVLGACVDGVVRTFDCRSAGFGSCASDRCQL